MPGRFVKRLPEPIESNWQPLESDQQPFESNWQKTEKDQNRANNKPPEKHESNPDIFPAAKESKTIKDLWD